MPGPRTRPKPKAAKEPKRPKAPASLDEALAIEASNAQRAKALRDEVKSTTAPTHKRGSFDPAKREALIAAVRKGLSLSYGCRLIGITNQVAYVWLRRGSIALGEPGHRPEYAQFASDFRRAEAEKVAELLDHASLQSTTDHRATKTLLDMLDRRQGMAQRQKAETIALAKQQTELAIAQEQLRMARMKGDATEAAIKTGGQAMIVIGISAFLESSDLSPEIKGQIIASIGRAGGTAIARRDLGAEPDRSDGSDGSDR